MEKSVRSPAWRRRSALGRGWRKGCGELGAWRDLAWVSERRRMRVRILGAEDMFKNVMDGFECRKGGRCGMAVLELS